MMARCILPVRQLFFGQDSVSAHMVFSGGAFHGGSVYYLLDELQRGNVNPLDLPALTVQPRGDGTYWAAANRRLMALKAFQSWHESEDILVNVHIESSIEVTNKNGGQDVFTRPFTQSGVRGRSMHWGNDLFTWPQKREQISTPTADDDAEHHRPAPKAKIQADSTFWARKRKRIRQHHPPRKNKKTFKEAKEKIQAECNEFWVDWLLARSVEECSADVYEHPQYLRERIDRLKAQWRSQDEAVTIGKPPAAAPTAPVLAPLVVEGPQGDESRAALQLARIQAKEACRPLHRGTAGTSFERMRLTCGTRLRPPAADGYHPKACNHPRG